jgi:hypothetical protein
VEERKVIGVMQIRDSSWLLVIAAMWALVASIPVFERYMPASFWLEVNHISVFDTVVGQSPLMVVDRTIHRPFKAQWIAEVERWDGDSFEVLPNCTGRGENNYSPENKLPKRLDLKWWVYPTDCTLEPGQYRIETRWTLPGDQTVRAVSNIFAVTN